MPKSPKSPKPTKKRKTSMSSSSSSKMPLSDMNMNDRQLNKSMTPLNIDKIDIKQENMPYFDDYSNEQNSNAKYSNRVITFRNWNETNWANLYTKDHTLM